MILLCITDIHGDLASYQRILQYPDPVDVILLGGDLTNFGTPDQAEGIVRAAQQRCPMVLAVAGNCDSAAIDQRLSELGVSLFGRGIEYQRVGFYGVSAMPPWQGTMYEISEARIAGALDEGRAMLKSVTREVVLSHTPPRGTRIDATQRGAHVGSTSVRELIDRVQPALVVSGHIHESRGIDKVGRTAVVNCGPAFKRHFAVAELSLEVRVTLQRA